MLITVDSRKSVSRIQDELPRVCATYQFGVLAVHDLTSKMREKGVDYPYECLIFEVCSLQKAKQILQENVEMSALLPCRISVYRTPQGKTQLATLSITKLFLDFLHVPALKDLAEEVEKTLVAIMKQVA